MKLTLAILMAVIPLAQIATVNVNRNAGQNVAAIVSLPEQTDATVPFRVVTGRIDFPVVAGAPIVSYGSHKQLHAMGKLTVTQTPTGIDWAWDAGVDGSHTGDLFQVVVKCTKAGSGAFAMPVTAKNAAGAQVQVGIENTNTLTVLRPAPVVSLTLGNAK